MRIRTYSELIRFKTLEDRFNYLKLGGRIGEITFGYDRILNQVIYGSDRWKKTRREVIIRDDGCDLGIKDYELHGGIWVHHMNPISIEDIENENDDIFNPEFLICSGKLTHSAIHYGDISLLPKPPIERRQNDTCPWR